MTTEFSPDDHTTALPSFVQHALDTTRLGEQADEARSSEAAGEWAVASVLQDEVLDEYERLVVGPNIAAWDEVTSLMATVPFSELDVNAHYIRMMWNFAHPNPYQAGRQVAALGVSLIAARSTDVRVMPTDLYILCDEASGVEYKPKVICGALGAIGLESVFWQLPPPAERRAALQQVFLRDLTQIGGYASAQTAGNGASRTLDGTLAHIDPHELERPVAITWPHHDPRRGPCVLSEATLPSFVRKIAWHTDLPGPFPHSVDIDNVTTTMRRTLDWDTTRPDRLMGLVSLAKQSMHVAPA